jgi:hypothetical protein
LSGKWYTVYHKMIQPWQFQWAEWWIAKIDKKWGVALVLDKAVSTNRDGKYLLLVNIAKWRRRNRSCCRLTHWVGIWASIVNCLMGITRSLTREPIEKQCLQSNMRTGFVSVAHVRRTQPNQHFMVFSRGNQLQVSPSLLSGTSTEKSEESLE